MYGVATSARKLGLTGSRYGYSAGVTMSAGVAGSFGTNSAGTVCSSVGTADFLFSKTTLRF